MSDSLRFALIVTEGPHDVEAIAKYLLQLLQGRHDTVNEKG